LKILLTSDWHFTDSIYDEYKWELFPYLKNLCQFESIDRIFMLGDITEKKDNHPSKLVNKLTESITFLSQTVPIIFLQGNHDAVDANIPFFKFLNTLPNVGFITEPQTLYFGDHSDFLFIPYQKEVDNLYRIFHEKIKANYVFIHQTVSGAISQSGHVLEHGLDSNFLDHPNIFAGDIHKPQKIGNVQYVGSPYHVYFGDNYEGQVIILDTEYCKTQVMKPGFISKFSTDLTSMEELKNMDIKKGDQMKIKLHLRKEDYYLVSEVRTQIKEYLNDKKAFLMSFEIFPIMSDLKTDMSAIINKVKETKEQVVERFGKKETLNQEYIDFGTKLMGI
jgi:hypothetical protein